MHTYSIQDALRAFMPPLGSDDDPRLDFYMMYKREATEYDVNYVKKYDEDLNITLIFVRLSPPPFCCRLLNVPTLGRSILCSQLSLRHRHSVQIAA